MQLDKITHADDFAVWRKASYSQDDAQCVEAAFIGDDTAVRDTKNRDQGFITCSGTAWTAFLDTVRA